MKPKLLFHRPDWGNRWIPYYAKILPEYFDVEITSEESGDTLGPLSEKADILFSAWANPIVSFWSQYFGDKPLFTYLRRYEIWYPELYKSILWESVDGMFFVSEYYDKTFTTVMKELHYPIPKKRITIPNVIDLTDFPLRETPPKTTKIAFIANIRDVKNMPLACQILLHLPKEWKLYQIGLGAQSTHYVGQIISYIEHLGLSDRWIFEPSIPREEIPGWLEDKQVALSTSVNEGNPNAVLEAMARGIKPVIHNWPGALSQFPPDMVFNKIEEAIHMICGPDYDPKRYRDIIKKQYSMDNIHRVAKTILEWA